MDTEKTTSPAHKAQAEPLKPGKPIDVARCLRGMRNVVVNGAPYGSRIELIETAINLILKDGVEAMAREYLAFKRYAGFGDQRCDCEYGMGPRHGSVVFDIRRTHKARVSGVALGTDEIYLLECVRDFGSEQIPCEHAHRKTEPWNLCDILRMAESLRHDLTYLDSYLAGARVEEQCQKAGA